MQYGAAVVFVVVNNSMYGTIRMHQEREYPARVFGTDLRNPDFAQLARAYGAHGAVVEKHSRLRTCFRGGGRIAGPGAARAAGRFRSDYDTRELERYSRERADRLGS